MPQDLELPYVYPTKKVHCFKLTFFYEFKQYSQTSYGKIPVIYQKVSDSLQPYLEVRGDSAVCQYWRGVTLCAEMRQNCMLLLEVTLVWS